MDYEAKLKASKDAARVFLAHHGINLPAPIDAVVATSIAAAVEKMRAQRDDALRMLEAEQGDHAKALDERDAAMRQRDELAAILRDRPYIGGKDGHEWNERVNAALAKVQS